MDYKILEHVPLFSRMDPEDLAALACLVTKKKFCRGNIIILQGEPGEGMYVVLKGKARVFSISPSGKEVTLAVLGEKNFFGEMSLLDGRARSASVMADSSVEALSLSRGSFDGFLHAHPDAALKILQVLVDRLRQANLQIESLALLGVKARLARFLLSSALLDAGSQTGRVAFRLPYSHKELSNLLGASRETITRAMTELREEGYIEGAKAEMAITDVNALRNLLGE